MTNNRIPAASFFIVFALLCVFAATGAGAASRLDISGPEGTIVFGNSVTALPNGNIVVTAVLTDTPQEINRAVYLYNGKTGALISTLTGKFIGGSVNVLPNSNFVVQSYFWDDGAASDLGAVTWCSGTTGCSGTVSAANSLVGATAGDSIGGNNIIILPNSNYIVPGQNWDNGATANAGAVTFCDGNTGCAGVVSAANSLIGTSANDFVGFVYVLPNGNYIVSSRNWDNGAAADAGAITWCSGATGCAGAISVANSLVGTHANDSIGNFGIMNLSNGNYVVVSREWDNGAVSNAGAVTWGNGLGGTVGEISAANSIVGAQTDDFVGNSLITPLTNGNYVVRSRNWDNGAVADAGAATWCSGLGGTVGEISAANSLVGTHPGDSVGERMTALTNGNYVVYASAWNNGKIADAGAVTWGDGTVGAVGAISAANSLVGTQAGEGVGNYVHPLTNGNYVVESSGWNNGTILRAGAVTWGNGSGGTVGTISAANSLVGIKADELVGQRVVPLPNGNYVVATQNWSNNLATRAGAVTWGSGLGGTVGAVSPANSLVGTQAFDTVGEYIDVLPNGNYVVSSWNWKNGAAARAGAVTWGDGMGGTVGAVSAANSIVGTSAEDNVGGQGVTILSNGNYVVNSNLWNNQGAVDSQGAVTWGNGAGGTAGAISAANSLIGTRDRFSNSGGNRIFALPNGNYLVRNISWKNGAVNEAGAVTWGNGYVGTAGVVSASNSLVGMQSGDMVGEVIKTLPNGNYVVSSKYWKNGSVPNAGALTYGAGNGGTVGEINTFNSILGANGGDGGGFTYSYDSFNETLVVGRRYNNIVSIFNPTFTTIADGDWSAGATWDYGAFNKLHDVYIPDGKTVNLDVIAAVGSLRIDCAGAISGANSTAYIIGNIRKDFCATGAFRYPTGTANGFSPVDTNVTALGVNPSSLTVSAAQGVHPALNPNYSLKRFWTLAETGDLTTDLTFNYLDPTDISSAEPTYKLYRVTGGVPAQVTPFVLNTGENTVSTTGVSNFSQWAVGNTEPVTVNLSGRITTASGAGISKAKVVLTDSNGVNRIVYTGSFGFYQFDNIPSGGTYTISVTSGRFIFTKPAQVVTVNDNLNDVNFIAEP
jgi:hypothetical protein